MVGLEPKLEHTKRSKRGDHLSVHCFVIAQDLKLIELILVEMVASIPMNRSRELRSMDEFGALLRTRTQHRVTSVL